MKRFVKTLMLGAVGALLASQSVQAAYVANDLILGFNQGNGSGPNDYIVDLGNANSAVGVGGSQQVTLGAFNGATFNSLYGGFSGGVTMGAAGGQGALTGRDLYMTVLRTANIGSQFAGIAGSTAPTPVASTPMANGVNQIGAMVNGLGLSAGGSANVPQSDPNSWWNNVLDPQNANTFFSKTGRNPNAGDTSASILYEDLYRGTPSGAFTYLGYLALDSSAGTLVFTPSAFVPVPEPSTYGIIAGSGLLLLTLRRQIKGQLA
jgi:hypothetical protein